MLRQQRREHKYRIVATDPRLRVIDLWQIAPPCFRCGFPRPSRLRWKLRRTDSSPAPSELRLLATWDLAPGPAATTRPVAAVFSSLLLLLRMQLGGRGDTVSRFHAVCISAYRKEQSWK